MSKPKNKVTVYWEQSTYTTVDMGELAEVPAEVQKMIVNSILETLGVGMRLI